MNDLLWWQYPVNRKNFATRTKPPYRKPRPSRYWKEEFARRRQNRILATVERIEGKLMEDE